MHFGMPVSNRRAADEIVHQIDERLELGFTKEIDSTKDHSGIFRSWLECEMDFFARMQGFAFYRDFP